MQLIVVGTSLCIDQACQTCEKVGEPFVARHNTFIIFLLSIPSANVNKLNLFADAGLFSGVNICI